MQRSQEALVHSLLFFPISVGPGDGTPILRLVQQGHCLLSQLVVGVKYYSHDMSPSVFLSCVLIGAG